MLKFIRNLIIFLVIVAIGLVAVSFWFLNSIKYTVTSDDLPQDVYETSGSLLPFAKLKVVALITADDEERYTLIEEFMNMIILDSVRENINEDYDPLNDCDDTDCGRIIDEEYFFIDYAFAKLNDDNQIVVTISGGANKYISTTTAIRLVFDVDFDITLLDPDNSQVVFTLTDYYLGDRELSLKLLDYIFNRMDKDSVEESMTFGTLDLDDYTYTISISDALL